MRNRLARGYVLSGPQGVGKRALGIEIARVLNCHHLSELTWKGECDCRSCFLISSGDHPNLIWLTPYQGKEEAKVKEAFAGWAVDTLKSPYRLPQLPENGRILVEGVRELRQRLSYKADGEGVRCVMIYPGEAMNDNAANALLKILEEPPERTLFLLLVESPRGLLPTILSRCQVMELKPLKKEEVIEGLEQYGFGDDEKNITWAQLSQGSLTRALQLAQGDFPEMVSLAMQFLRAAVMGRVRVDHQSGKARQDKEISLWEFINEEILNRWEKSHYREDRESFFEALKLCLKDSLYLAGVGEAAVGGEDLVTCQIESGVKRMGLRYRSEVLMELWEEAERTRLACEANVNPTLALVVYANKVRNLLK